MPTETIRPTAHTVVSGIGSNQAQAYNGNTANWGTTGHGTEGQSSQLNLHTFPADTSPSGRTQVLLNMAAGWATTDADDEVRVYFRKVSTDPWTLLFDDQPTGNWGSNPSSIATQTADITALAGSQPSTDWQVAVQFFNGGAATGGPPPPAT